jgi:hypothetical protein
MSFVDKAKDKVEELKDKAKDAAGVSTDDAREGVSDTDVTPAGPHGVGISTSTPGNEQPLPASEESHRSDRLDTGVSRERNVDPESPAMHPGDQGS